jgi:hypothetical protein
MFRRMGTVGNALLSALMVACTGIGLAVAQESGESTVDVVRVEPIGERSSGQPISLTDQREAAEAAVEAAAASCDAQSEALQRAKREGDIIRATCLEDKLNQCNANLQNVRRRQTALNNAIASGDTAAANHESKVISVLSQKFKMLTQAANECVGQDLFDTGETQTRSEVDLFAPDENPAVIEPIPDWPIPYIPPPLSGVS